MSEIDRDVIRRELKRWQKGEIDERAVHEWAEDLFGEIEPKELPDNDPLSIAVEVLSQLEVLNFQLITPEDIPAMLEFLETPRGNEVGAWKRWHEYWDSLNMKARKRSLALNPYYSKS